MTRRLELRPWMTDAKTRRLLDALGAGDLGTGDLGGRALDVRFVGGCVRDAALGRPVQDVDIGTPEPPPAVIARLDAAGLRAIPTGIDHGTVTAIVEHAPFEITSLRRDVETDGRRAVVAYTADWAEDAARRDFTMNAMSCRADGTLFDYFGGWEDLHSGAVRFVGDPATRIREDMLRILRFYRFHAHYGRGEPDPEARAACRALADTLPRLSVERMRDETLRLLEAPAPHQVLEIMRADGILAAYFPEESDFARLARLVGLETTFAAPDRLRRLAATLAPDADPAAVADRFRLSGAQRDRLVAARRDVADFDPDERGAALRRRFHERGAERWRDAALLWWAGQERVDEEALCALLAEAAAWRPKRMPVSGADAKALGLKTGPRIGEALRRVESWWVDNDFAPGRAEALEKLREVVAEIGGG